MSVNTFVPPAPFPHYPRAVFFHETSFAQQQNVRHHPRQHRVLCGQQLVLPPFPPSFQHAPQRLLTTMNPALNNTHQAFSPGYSREDAKAMMTGNFDDCFFGPVSGSGMPMIPAYQQHAGNQYAFRPLDPSESSSFEAQLAKCEGSQETGIMPIQTTHVDQREYSPVSTEEVFFTPHDTSSPSSIDTDEDSPITPAFDQHSTFFDHYAAKYGPPDAQLFSNAPHTSRSEATAYGSFSSYTSEASMSYLGSSSSFSGTYAHGNAGSGQIYGPAVHYPVPAEALMAPTVSHPQFDPHASTMSDNMSESEEDDDASSASSQTSAEEPGIRHDRDRLLLDLRNQGLSYKEIKHQGGFKEAESTLRGRMRVLTKEKHERVRKPVWQVSDVSDLTCLSLAVRCTLTRLRLSSFAVRSGSPQARSPPAHAASEARSFPGSRSASGCSRTEPPTTSRRRHARGSGWRLGGGEEGRRQVNIGSLIIASVRWEPDIRCER